MTQKFSNYARSRLVGALSSGATSFTIEADTADLFKVANTTDWLTPLDWFKAVIENDLGQFEIVYVGVRSLSSGVFANVLRGQEGTTAIAWDAGAIVGCRVTAEDIENALAGVVDQLEVVGNAVVHGDANIEGKITHNGIESRTVPVGGIIMYGGEIADIPGGWQLCDGTNGTPDLRDKFVIGARQDDAGVAKTNVTGTLTVSGGEKDAVAVTHGHTATAGVQSANHTHGGTAAAAGSHSHTVSGAVNAGGLGYNTGSAAAVVSGVATSDAGSHSHTVTTGNQSTDHNHVITVAAAGESGTNKNLPPYYALAFIRCMAYV